MKKLLIDINLDNAAFEGADAGAEIASILRDLADKLRTCRRWDNVEYRITNRGQRTLSICRPSSRNHYYTEAAK